jgi:hypothetical protein
MLLKYISIAGRWIFGLWYLITGGAWLVAHAMGRGAAPRSVATVERYLSTIAHAHALANLPDPTKTAQVKGACQRRSETAHLWRLKIAHLLRWQPSVCLALLSLSLA